MTIIIASSNDNAFRYYIIRMYDYEVQEKKNVMAMYYHT